MKADMEYAMDSVLAWLSKTKAYTKRELATLTGYSERDIKWIVRALRVERKIPVCSGNKGYWLPDGNNDAAIRRTVARLKSQRNEMSILISILENRPLEGQMEVSA